MMAQQSIETFSAPTMHEALARVRESLGPDAVILHTRQTKGLFAKKGQVVEVTASRGSASVIEKHRDVAPPSTRSETRVKSVPATSSLEDQVRRLQRLVDRMSGMPAGDAAPSPHITALQEHLLAAEFPLDLTKELIDRATSQQPNTKLSLDDLDLMEHLVAHLATRLRTASCIEDTNSIHSLALIGPTGVGKTTTVARLAAHALDLGRSVHLITIDEYRVGAADEIRRYAEIFGVPWSMARTPAELRRLIDRQPRETLSIIDTPGRAAVEQKELAELARFLERGITKALVLSANIRESSARASLDAFRLLDYQRLIFTKLDETPGTGAVAALAMMSPVPVSYLCLGQSIRGDLQPADSLRLARWALGEIARPSAEPVVVEA
jgi:flagellar biosynthesis protein FlhF